MNNNPYDQADISGDQPSQSAPRMVAVRPPAPNPWVTYTLVGVTIAVYLVQVITQLVFREDIPAVLGVKYNPLILQGQFWRLFTPIFLHSNIISPVTNTLQIQNILHIGFNMYALYIIGRELEQNYGHLRFIVLYFVAGIAGNVFSFAFTNRPDIASLGASTSIFGLLAAQGVFVYQNRELLGRAARPMLNNILLLMAINLVLGFSSFAIDNWGHLGGLIGGAVFSWFAGPIMQVRASFRGYELVDQRGMGRAWATAAVEMVILIGLVYQYILLHPSLS